MKKLIFCLAILSCFVSCEPPGGSSDYFGAIEVFVSDNDTDEYIAEVDISLSPAVSTCLTDFRGYCKMGDLESPQYDVHAQKSGYDHAHVNSVSVTAGKVTTLSIKLKKTKKSDN